MPGSRSKALVWVPALLFGAVGAFFLRHPVARAGLSAAYRFDPRRVELQAAAPDWLAPSMARSIFREYLRVCGAPFPLIDDEAFHAWLEALRSLPWVSSLKARRDLPRLVDLSLELRRPAALVPGKDGDFRLLGERGRELPLDPGERARRAAAPPDPSALGKTWTERSPFSLPWILGAGPWPPDSEPEARPWREGAALAALWRDRFRPRVARILRALRRPDQGEGGRESRPLPVLVGIDVSELAGLGGLRGDSADHALLVRTPAHRLVRLLWGHGNESPYERVPWEEKALTLARILRRFPGLEGLAQADLRFPNRWRDHCVRLPAR